MTRALVLLALLAPLAIGAAEARLDLPELVVPGTDVDVGLNVIDPPAPATQVQLPPVDGLTWQLIPGYHQRSEVRNGASVTVTHTYAVRLHATREGQIAIPPVTVVLTDGSTIATAATTLKAAPGDARLTGDAYAEAEFDPPTIVAGQPCTLIYRFVASHAVSPRGLAVEPPTDQVKLGEPTQQECHRTAQDGRSWQGFEIRWPMTFATAGERRAGGGQQEYAARAVDEDVFGFGRSVTRRVAIKPATLTVTPLPTAGRPDDFHGLIGPASIAATLERARIAVGEGTTLTVAITGRQVDLEPRPALPPLPGVTAYPRDVPASADGARRFAWDLVPAAAGAVTVPPLTIAYFDADARAYRHASSAALTLAVVPGREQRLAVTGKAVVHDDAAAPATLTGPRLPAPFGTDAPRSLPPAAPVASFAGMLCVGALAMIAADRRRRGPRAPDPARLLARAIARGDLDGAAHALQAAGTRLRSDAARADAQRLAALIDLARFGGAPLADEARAIADRLERA